MHIKNNMNPANYIQPDMWMVPSSVDELDEKLSNINRSLIDKYKTLKLENESRYKNFERQLCEMDCRIKNLDRLLCKIHDGLILKPNVDNPLNCLIEEGIQKGDLEKTRQILKEQNIDLNKRYVRKDYLPEIGPTIIEENYPLQEVLANFDRIDDYRAEDALEMIALSTDHGAKLNMIFGSPDPESDYKRSFTLISNALEIYNSTKRKKILDYLLTQKELFKGIDLYEDFRELHFNVLAYHIDSNGQKVCDAVQLAEFLFEMGASIPQHKLQELSDFIFFRSISLSFEQVAAVFAKNGYDLPESRDKIE